MSDSEDFNRLTIDPEFPPDHKSGFVAVIGKPNVGKSTLMNQFLGEKLAIVSPKPQTTRFRQLGILTHEDVQIVFVDTPGLHLARNMLGEYMVEEAKGIVPDADLILFIVDVSTAPNAADIAISKILRPLDDIPILLILNKADLVPDDFDLHVLAQAYIDLIPHAEAIALSAFTGEGCEKLIDYIIEQMPEGPRFYPEDQLTDTQLRENVAEIVREKILLLLEQEVPHSVAVQVDEFKERDNNKAYVRATIFVERESQKGIVIGKKGVMLKEVGKLARADIASVIGTDVYLDLWVKVLKNWRSDAKSLRRLGYYIPENE